MHETAGSQITVTVFGVDRLAADDGLRMFGDDLLVDILQLARMQRLDAVSAVVRFQADAIRFVIPAGKLEEAAVATQDTFVAVDFISEIGQRADEAAARFAEGHLDGAAHSIQQFKMNIGTVFGLDGQCLGKIDGLDFTDGAVEHEFRHVETVAGDVADGAPHLIDVVAAPCGCFFRRGAVEEFHVEAGIVDNAGIDGNTII